MEYWYMKNFFNNSRRKIRLKEIIIEIWNKVKGVNSLRNMGF